MNRREFVQLIIGACAAPVATGVLDKIAPMLVLPEADPEVYVAYMVQLSTRARNGQTLESWAVIDKALALFSGDPARHIAREVEMARIAMSNHPQFDPYQPVTVTDFGERLYRRPVVDD